MSDLEKPTIAHTNLLVEGAWGTVSLDLYLPSHVIHPIANLTVKASIGAFALCKIELKVTSEYPSVVNIVRGDRVTVVSNYGTDKFLPMFKGEVFDVEIERKENSQTYIHLTARSSFYRLALFSINDGDIALGKGLRETLAAVLAKCGVAGHLKVHADIDDSLELAFVDRFPALSLVNTILQHKDLVYECHIGHELLLSYRRNAVHKMRQRMPITIQDKDLKSFKLNR